jgi:hypothetical protein
MIAGFEKSFRVRLYRKRMTTLTKGTKLADTLNWKYSECDPIGIERKATRNADINVLFCEE